MNKSRSIKQNVLPDALPNFRNLGITLRILVLSTGMASLLAIMQAGGWADLPQRMMDIATGFTPVLLGSLLLLWFAQPRLKSLSYRRGVQAVGALVLLLTLFVHHLGRSVFGTTGGDYFYDAMRYGLFALIVCAILLFYFWLRSQILSHALHEARLQVLRARIRPHFLFNTINTVLSMVRAQPKQAETALENMADMFRVAMSETQDMVPIHREIQLSRQYVSLEQMRMGERLNVNWQIENIPDDALIPPLLLQPLLENAMYHGIEPLPEGGSVNVTLRRKGDELHIRVENPCAVQHASRQDVGDVTGSYAAQKMEQRRLHPGNKMALRNIRERLALLFDAEARYQVDYGKDYYRVEIVMPYVTELPL
jgi:two-component system sensor histidine kinase AlgZ